MSSSREVTQEVGVPGLEANSKAHFLLAYSPWLHDGFIQGLGGAGDGGRLFKNKPHPRQIKSEPVGAESRQREI